MAIAIHSGHRQAASRPAWVRRRDAENHAGLGTFMVLLVLASVAALAISAQYFRVTAPWSSLTIPGSSVLTGAVDGAETESPVLDRVISEKTAGSQAAPSSKTDSAAETSVPAPVVAPRDTASDAPPVAAAPAPTAAPVPEATTQPAPAIGVGSHARVVNTDGRGVVLHSAPRKGARRPAGLLEGASVTVVDLAGEGEAWARVEGGRQSGWVPTEYLARAD